MKKTFKTILLSIFVILTFSTQQAKAECECICTNHKSTLVCDSDRDRKKYCYNTCY